MKVAAISGLAAVAALAGAGMALPAAAQPYPGYSYDGRNPCQEKQHDNGTAGALLGGVGGALLGNSIAHGGGRAGGTIIGGVAGAVVGNNIGRSSAKSSDACQGFEYHSYYNGYAPQYGGYYQQPPPYYGDRYYHERYDDDDD